MIFILLFNNTIQYSTCVNILLGEEAPSGTPYVVGGFQASINQVPWHAGVYKFNGSGFSLQCGATIINARVIVSAMHCMFHLFNFDSI